MFDMRASIVFGLVLESLLAYFSYVCALSYFVLLLFIMYDDLRNTIQRTAPGELAYPLKEKRSRYTHLSNNANARTVLIHKPKYIITADKKGVVHVWQDKSILIQDGVIVDIFDPAKKKIDLNSVELVYDGSKRGGIIVTPGFVNMHTHPPMYLLRSSLMLEKGENLERSLKDMFAFESRMTEEDFYVSTIGDFTEEQKNGITTTLSHYAVFNPLEEAAKLLRHNVVNAISAVSNSHPENTPEYVEGLLKNRKKYYTQIAVAIHTMHSAQPQVLKKVAQLVKKYKTLFTTHVAETQASVQRNFEVHGDLTVKTLERYGLANERTVMSHGVHLTDEEVAIVKKNRIGVVHLPTSNKLHKSGEFPYLLFKKHKATDLISLGTDSVISKNSLDILSEALQARIMHQDKSVIYYEELFKMMTCNGAESLGMHDRGRILPGFKADLAFWKVRDRGITPYDEENPVTLIGNMITHGGRDVRDLMINGEFVISNRRHNLVAETELMIELQKHHQLIRRRVPKE